MKLRGTLEERVAGTLGDLSAAERRVATLFRTRRDQVLAESAASLASLAKTSDATVVRTARALGYEGLPDLRRALAAEMRGVLSPARRLRETLDEVGNDLQVALQRTTAGQAEAMEGVSSLMRKPAAHATVEAIAAAKRVVVFGLGPSGALAIYFSMQLKRYGQSSAVICRSGLLFADDLLELREGDLVVALAYTRVYPELSALIDRVRSLKLEAVLITDTLASKLKGGVTYALSLERGKAGMLSMHTGTFALLEALLVGVAWKRGDAAIEHLDLLNDFREQVAGKNVKLAVDPD